MKESNTTAICIYCKHTVTGPLHIMKVNCGVIEMSGALYGHWSSSCSYFDEYHAKLKLVAAEALNHPKFVQSQLRVILAEDGDKTVQCLKLSNEFERSKAESAEFLNEWKINHKETYPFPVIASDNITITDDFKFLQQFGKLASESHYHKSEGYMAWISG